MTLALHSAFWLVPGEIAAILVHILFRYNHAPIYNVIHASPFQSLCGSSSTIFGFSLPEIVYVIKWKSLPENSPDSCIFESENMKPFEESPSKFSPHGIHSLLHLEKFKINLVLINNVSFLDIAPWTLLAPVVCFDLTKLIIIKKKIPLILKHTEF